jgi:hypothetical protein
VDTENERLTHGIAKYTEQRMELRRFHNTTEAEAWYRRRLAGGDSTGYEIFLALCLGEDLQAQRLYGNTEFPSRWWADIAYMQGHYLIRLRRRDRLIHLAGDLGIDTGVTRTDNPLLDLRSMALAMEARAAQTMSSKPAAAVLYCLLGHTYLAMDAHESANTAYGTAIQLDRSVWIPWENTTLLEFTLDESLNSTRNCSS